MNIATILQEKARLSGGSEAIIEPGRARDRLWARLRLSSTTTKVTYAQLYENTCNIATQLSRSGIGKNDVVLVATSMSSDLYAVLLAVFQVGATAMFIDIGQGAKHLERCLSIVTPKAIVSSWKFCLATLLTEKTRAIPLKFQLGSGLLPGFRQLHVNSQLISISHSTQRTSCSVPGTSVTPDHPALITFTSGSTGVPKAIVRSHGFLLTQLDVLSRHTSVEPAAQRELVTLPIFVLANLASGTTSIIPNANLKKPGSYHEKPVIDQVESLSPSRITASPAFLDRLAAYAILHNKTFPSVKSIFTGGGPVFPQTIDAASRAFPNADIQTVYGSTEAEPIALTSSRCLTLEERTKMLNGAGLLVGKPISEIEVKIVSDTNAIDGTPMTDARWAELTAHPEVAGEIVVAGEHVVNGYLNGQGDAETKVKVAGKTWHRTGDAGYFDSAGRLWLVGRHGNRISCKDDCEHGQLFPFQVESVAKAKAGVSAAALISSTSNSGSIKRILVIECRSRRKARKIVAELSNQLAWAKLDEVLAVRRIPTDKRHNSKVVYDQLKRNLNIA